MNNNDHEWAYTDGGQSESLTEDEIDNIFIGLANTHRRCIAACFQAQSIDTATLDELVEPLVSISPHTKAELSVALRHHHIQDMEVAGILELEEESGTVRYHSIPLAEELLACADTTSMLDYQSLWRTSES